jgi:hypothetical protein
MWAYCRIKCQFWCLLAEKQESRVLVVGKEVDLGRAGTMVHKQPSQKSLTGREY